jgi:hypothetical protein
MIYDKGDGCACALFPFALFLKKMDFWCCFGGVWSAGYNE